MTLLIILGVILLIILGVLFIPVVVDLEFKDDFKLKLSFLKITLFKTKPQSYEKSEDIQKERSQPKEKKEKASVLKGIKRHFNAGKEKYGFSAMVQELMALIKETLSHIKSLLRHINICKLKLDITVGTDDAAKTAFDYGLVCNAVYPVTAFLSSQKIGFKEINVNADFENGRCNFEFKGTVKMQIFYLLVCAFKIYGTLKKFIVENSENERQQH